MLESLTISRQAIERTIRLVTTARLRDSVLNDLVDESELDALSEIEGATSNRRMAQARGAGDVPSNQLVHGVPHAHFVNAAFAYAKPREPNRFNGAERGAWYAGFEIETSLAEVKFHLTEVLAAAGDFNATVDYAEMFASFAGEFVDLRLHPAHPSLDPEKTVGYPVGNALAEAARSRGLNGIIYPSVRNPGGTCLVALFPHAVQSVAQGSVYRMTWRGQPEPTVQRVKG